MTENKRQQLAKEFMKKLELKKPIENPPIEEPKVIEETPPKKAEKPTKEKPDYSWVWALIGLLSIIGVMYFMNINNNKDDGRNIDK